MVTATAGKIVKNYKSETFMLFGVDGFGREFPLNQSPLFRRAWYKDLSSELSAIERACGSFLYQAHYVRVEESAIPYAKIKVLFYKSEMGDPRSKDIIYIPLSGTSKIRLSYGIFSVTIDGADLQGVHPKVLKLEILKDAEKQKKHNLLITKKGRKKGETDD